MNIGRRVYGLAAIGMGLVGFVFHDFTPLWRAAPGHLPTHEALVFARYALMIAGGLAINLGRRIAQAGALVLAADFAMWMAIAAGPPLLHDWKTWVNWENLAEQTSMILGGLIAWSLLGAGDDARRIRVAEVARPVFGLCLIVFGLSDVVYLKFTASLVPTWLPPSQVFWTWVACVAHIAAGLAVLSRVQARLAAILITTMYVVFALVVHLPLVIREPHNPGHWVEQGGNLIMLGAAWCLADWLGRARKPDRA
jgi:hypothetical protein